MRKCGKSTEKEEGEKNKGAKEKRRGHSFLVLF